MPLRTQPERPRAHDQGTARDCADTRAPRLPVPVEAGGHVTSGAITVLGVHASHYASAESLIVQYGNRKGLRTLDALQLAVALDVKSRVGLDAFVVADITCAEVAQAQGLSVTNPETT